MKIPRAYVGKLAAIQWSDPNFRRSELKEVAKGRAALATWVEYGVIHDVTDGVVQIVHSAASGPGKPAPPEGTDEIAYTSVPESIIETVTLFEPMRPEVAP